MAKKPFGKPMPGGMPQTPGRSPFASASAARLGLTTGSVPKAPKPRMAPPAAPMLSKPSMSPVAPPKAKAKPAGVNPFAMGKKPAKKPPMGY